MPIPIKLANISNYKFICTTSYVIENGCKWRTLPKEYGKWHTIYVKFNRWSKNDTIAKAIDFSLWSLILVATKRQKLFNEGNSILLIDSTIIKVSTDANRSRNTQKRSIGRSKWGLTTKLHLCCTASYPVVFRLSPSNSHDANE